MKLTVFKVKTCLVLSKAQHRQIQWHSCLGTTSFAKAVFPSFGTVRFKEEERRNRKFMSEMIHHVVPMYCPVSVDLPRAVLSLLSFGWSSLCSHCFEDIHQTERHWDYGLVPSGFLDQLGLEKERKCAERLAKLPCRFRDLPKFSKKTFQFWDRTSLGSVNSQNVLDPWVGPKHDPTWPDNCTVFSRYGRICQTCGWTLWRCSLDMLRGVVLACFGCIWPN